MFHNILIPTDGSQAAMYAVTEFAKLASSAPSVRITLLTAVATRRPEDTDESSEWIQEENRRLRERAQDTLESAQETFTELGIEAEILVVEGAPASRVIAEQAQKGDHDLIVMASRGLGTDRKERFYLGSVTENVLRKVSRPVLVIPIHPEGRLSIEEFVS